MKNKNRYLQLLPLIFIGLLGTAIPAMAETTTTGSCSPELFTEVASIIVRAMNVLNVATTGTQACGITHAAMGFGSFLIFIATIAGAMRIYIKHFSSEGQI